jgi:hypothetical protein
MNARSTRRALVDNRAAMTPVVELEGARKRFGAVEALKASISRSARASWSRCSGPTGPARRRRSR